MFNFFRAKKQQSTPKPVEPIDERYITLKTKGEIKDDGSIVFDTNGFDKPLATQRNKDLLEILKKRCRDIADEVKAQEEWEKLLDGGVDEVMASFMRDPRNPNAFYSSEEAAHQSRELGDFLDKLDSEYQSQKSQ